MGGSLRGALGAVGAAGAIAGIKYVVDAASDLSEQVNKASVVFRGNEQKVLQWSRSTASSFGISRRAALEATGTFGNMLVPMGLGRDLAGEMSIKMVELGADMASFNNASPEETLQALRSGLAGETEPLRRFGVFLNEARIKQEALNLGLYDGTGALDAAAKAQATYAVILKDTKDTQGDFGRTSDSLANAQRRATAAFEDAAAELGESLVPALAELVSGLADAVKGVNDFVDALGGWDWSLSDATAGVKGLNYSLIDLGRDVKDHLVDPLRDAGPDVEEAVSNLGLTFEDALQESFVQKARIAARQASAALASVTWGEVSDIGTADRPGLDQPRGATPGMGNVRDASGSRLTNIVGYALRQQGRPYDWGGGGGAGGATHGIPGGPHFGEGIPGFDCSGLIASAYAQVGITLPRTAAGMARAGIPVGSTNDLQPGDIIVTRGGAHAVMYIGGGQVVAASSSAGKVLIQPLSWHVRSIYAMRRIVQGADADSAIISQIARANEPGTPDTGAARRRRAPSPQLTGTQRREIGRVESIGAGIEGRVDRMTRRGEQLLWNPDTGRYEAHTVKPDIDGLRREATNIRTRLLPPLRKARDRTRRALQQQRRRPRRRRNAAIILYLTELLAAQNDSLDRLIGQWQSIRDTIRDLAGEEAPEEEEAIIDDAYGADAGSLLVGGPATDTTFFTEPAGLNVPTDASVTPNDIASVGQISEAIGARSEFWQGGEMLRFDPATGKYIFTQLAPDIEALKKLRDYVLNDVLPALDARITATRSSLAKLRGKKKKDRKAIASLEALLEALVRERDELVDFVQTLSGIIGDLTAAANKGPENEKEGVPGDSSGGVPGLTAEQVEAQITEETSRNLLGFLGGTREVRGLAANILDRAAFGALGLGAGASDLLTGRAITVNFYNQQTSDPLSFTKGLEFELRALLG
jgi:cell wall-associated NlpC family hydrolase